MCGVDFAIPFLDGQQFRVQTQPGTIIHPDQIMTIEGKGMPFHKTSYKLGNMFVMFKIAFPK